MVIQDGKQMNTIRSMVVKIWASWVNRHWLSDAELDEIRRGN